MLRRALLLAVLSLISFTSLYAQTWSAVTCHRFGHRRLVAADRR
jgi:hypothetical protein